MAHIESNRTTVTSHDKKILKQIFSIGLPCDDNIDVEEETKHGLYKEAAECSKQVKKAKELEIQGVKAAEAGNFDSAINLFNLAVSIAPEWPSTYNNRAQALRLKGDITGAKADLERALEQSHETGNVACQAFTQRGLIRKREGDDEGAKQDFEKAANLGSGFAKQLLAAMNPYAALCNQMLCDVMHKLRSGQPEPEV